MTRKNKAFPFFLWHRRLGLAALVLVFILSITGIMLNHTESLKLDETLIENDLILNWYGINPEGTPVNYTSGDTWVSQWNQQVFFMGENLVTHTQQLQGIVQLNDMLIIALGNDVLLVDTDGEVIELMKHVSRAPIQKIGSLENQVFILDQDKQFYLSDNQLSQWHKQTGDQPPRASLWSVPSPLSNDQIVKLKQAYRGQGLNLERVILDLHSGRIFNDQWGVYIMDISAITMMLLGISGLWVWWSRKLKLRRKKHYQKHH